MAKTHRLICAYEEVVRPVSKSTTNRWDIWHCAWWAGFAILQEL